MTEAAVASGRFPSPVRRCFGSLISELEVYEWGHPGRSGDTDHEHHAGGDGDFDWRRRVAVSSFKLFKHLLWQSLGKRTEHQYGCNKGGDRRFCGIIRH